MSKRVNYTVAGYKVLTGGFWVIGYAGEVNKKMEPGPVVSQEHYDVKTHEEAFKLATVDFPWLFQSCQIFEF